jgi:hypothetical protein
MVQNNQKIYYFMLFLAIWTPPNGSKKVQEVLQVGGMYDPMSGLEKRPLTKSLDPFFLGEMVQNDQKIFFVHAVFGH